jgi:hypothetical protein
MVSGLEFEPIVRVEALNDEIEHIAKDRAPASEIGMAQANEACVDLRSVDRINAVDEHERGARLACPWIRRKTRIPTVTATCLLSCP